MFRMGNRPRGTSLSINQHSARANPCEPQVSLVGARLRHHPVRVNTRKRAPYCGARQSPRESQLNSPTAFLNKISNFKFHIIRVLTTLLRSYPIGLNGWLASINVPGVDARCSCGWRTQSVQHVLMMCPLYSNGRAELVRRADCEEMWRMLSTPEKTQVTARWFVRQGILRLPRHCNDI